MLRRKPTRIPISQIDIRELDEIENERKLQNESLLNKTNNINDNINNKNGNHNNKNQKKESQTFQFHEQRSKLPKQQRIGHLKHVQMQ